MNSWKSLSTQRYRLGLCDVLQGNSGLSFGLDVGTNHINTVVPDAVGDVAQAVRAQAKQPLLLYLLFEALTEEVVDHGIVYGAALCEHAWEETDFRRDVATISENRPQAHQRIG